MSGTIRSMPPSRAYDEGWERTFGRGNEVSRGIRAWEEGALRALGGKPCEVCGVVVLERHFDAEKRLSCITCIRLGALKAGLIAPFQEVNRAADVSESAPEAPGARGPGHRVEGHGGPGAGGEPAAGEAAADVAAGGADAPVEPGAGAALGHAGGT